MKTILRFIKPYKLLCFFTLLVMFLDVAGGLLIPTITADMINAGINGGNMDYLIRSGILMLIVTIVTSSGALLGSYLAADLSSKIGRDMRNALYDKSLTFSSYDFEQFGTGSDDYPHIERCKCGSARDCLVYSNGTACSGCLHYGNCYGIYD